MTLFYMPQWDGLSVLFLLCLVKCRGQITDDVRSNLEECYIYMAPSSIPGAGSGVFVTKDVPKGTEFVSSPNQHDKLLLIRLNRVLLKPLL